MTRLLADPPARVADIACGAGWSSIAIARAYPNVAVDGYDLDEASVELARENVAGTEVADRVTIHLRDAGDPELAGSYQLVTVFEAIHDMSAAGRGPALAARARRRGRRRRRHGRARRRHVHRARVTRSSG